MVNITADRTTEGEKPTNVTYPHTVNRIINSFKPFLRNTGTRLLSPFNKRSNNPYTTARCKPDKARTWLAPEIE